MQGESPSGLIFSGDDRAAWQNRLKVACGRIARPISHAIHKLTHDLIFGKTGTHVTLAPPNPGSAGLAGKHA
jgi:hypothetical protein